VADIAALPTFARRQGEQTLHGIDLRGTGFAAAFQLAAPRSGARHRHGGDACRL